LRVFGVGHLQDGPARVPEPGDVEEEPAAGLLQRELEAGPAVQVVVGEQVHVVAPHGTISGCVSRLAGRRRRARCTSAPGRSPPRSRGALAGGGPAARRPSRRTPDPRNRRRRWPRTSPGTGCPTAPGAHAPGTPGTPSSRRGPRPHTPRRTRTP